MGNRARTGILLGLLALSVTALVYQYVLLRDLRQENTILKSQVTPVSTGVDFHSPQARGADADAIVSSGAAAEPVGADQPPQAVSHTQSPAVELPVGPALLALTKTNNSASASNAQSTYDALKSALEIVHQNPSEPEAALKAFLGAGFEASLTGLGNSAPNAKAGDAPAPSLQQLSQYISLLNGQMESTSEGGGDLKGSAEMLQKYLSALQEALGTDP